MLWGWYEESKTNVKVTVKFEVLEKLRYLSSVRTKPLIQPIAMFESFEIQTQLSEQMSYLTFLTLGLVKYEAEDYDGAIERFTKALKFVPDAEQAIARDTVLFALHFYRGVAYYNKALDEHIFKEESLRSLHLPVGKCRYVTTPKDGNTYADKEELNKALADSTKLSKLILSILVPTTIVGYPPPKRRTRQGAR